MEDQDKAAEDKPQEDGSVPGSVTAPLDLLVDEHEEEVENTDGYIGNSETESDSYTFGFLFF